jgi:hypothetical protein
MVPDIYVEYYIYCMWMGPPFRISHRAPKKSGTALVSSSTNTSIYGSGVDQEDNPPIMEKAIGSQLEDDEDVRCEEDANNKGITIKFHIDHDS